MPELVANNYLLTYQSHHPDHDRNESHEICQSDECIPVCQIHGNPVCAAHQHPRIVAIDIKQTTREVAPFRDGPTRAAIRR